METASGYPESQIDPIVSGCNATTRSNNLERKAILVTGR